MIGKCSSINTAAIERPEFISEAASDFGSSTIVVAIEVIRQDDGSFLCFTNCGREHTGVEAVSWAQRAASLGAGELVVTSVDREGTGRGFDIELTRRISSSVAIPVIAHGGAGSIEHVAQVLSEGQSDAVAVASMLHYDAVKTLPFNPSDYEDEGNTEFLRHRRHEGFKRVHDCNLGALKAGLKERGLSPRLEATHG